MSGYGRGLERIQVVTRWIFARSLARQAIRAERQQCHFLAVCAIVDARYPLTLRYMYFQCLNLLWIMIPTRLRAQTVLWSHRDRLSQVFGLCYIPHPTKPARGLAQGLRR